MYKRRWLQAVAWLVSQSERKLGSFPRIVLADASGLAPAVTETPPTAPSALRPISDVLARRVLPLSTLPLALPGLASADPGIFCGIDYG